MRAHRQRLIALYGALLVLLLGADVARRELALVSGETILLALAPVDPRSLMQGDYMRLDYAISRELRTLPTPPASLVVRIDSQGVAHWLPGADPQTLAADERRLQPMHQTQIGPDAYFFEEGEAKLLEQARYGEFRLSKEGRMQLIGLADAAGKPLGQRRERW